MDKRTATLTLTEKLHDLGYINLVTDPAVKSYLLDNAKSAVLDLKEGRIITCDLTEEVWYLSDKFFSNFGGDSVSKTNIPTKLQKYSMVNYYFVENKDWHKASQLLVTPLALISNVEEKVLREKFYKNVPEEILKAFEVLNIPNFIEAYNVYYSSEPDKILTFNFGIYRPFQKEDKVELGDIIQGSSSQRYYLVDKIKSSGGIDGYRFQDEALKIPAKGGKDDQLHGNCDKDYIMPVKKRLYDINFFEFVFSLPYEEQNIGANKAILTRLNYSDSYKILLKEYSKVDHFKDYFSLLNEEDKKRIVDEIKKLPDQNKFLNSWMFNQGFDLELDYLKLYKEDAKMFIEYFKGKPQDVQELIVADLFNCKEVNSEVIKFLEKEYPHILRETAFKDK